EVARFAVGNAVQVVEERPEVLREIEVLHERLETADELPLLVGDEVERLHHRQVGVRAAGEGRLKLLVEAVVGRRDRLHLDAGARALEQAVALGEAVQDGRRPPVPELDLALRTGGGGCGGRLGRRGALWAWLRGGGRAGRRGGRGGARRRAGGRLGRGRRL